MMTLLGDLASAVPARVWEASLVAFAIAAGVMFGLLGWRSARTAAKSVGSVVRGAVRADAAHRDRMKEIAAAISQYGLLFFFTGTSAAISAKGIVGFATHEWKLDPPLPWLVYLAVDGMAGMFAVLMVRRAARGESSMAPRLFAWSLIAVSALFNWSDAPEKLVVQFAAAMMPIIAGIAFEFSLAEGRRARRAENAPQRRTDDLSWWRPFERLRVQAHMLAHPDVTTAQAISAVRIKQAAAAIYRLRRLKHSLDTAHRATRWLYRHDVAAADRACVAALDIADFADPAVAEQVLRRVQVLTQTSHLAAMDYASSAAARTHLANMIPAGSATALPAGPDAWSAVSDPESPSGPPTADTSHARTADSNRPRQRTARTADTPDTATGKRPGGQSGTRHRAAHKPDSHVLTPSAADVRTARRRAGQEEFAELVAKGWRIVEDDPDISGADLARRLGIGEKRGRRVKDRIQTLVDTDTDLSDFLGDPPDTPNLSGQTSDVRTSDTQIASRHHTDSADTSADSTEPSGSHHRTSSVTAADTEPDSRTRDGDEV